VRAGVAAVTGAGRGIGRVTAARLAADGDAVALLARRGHEVQDAAAEIAAAGGTALAVACDVRDRGQVDRAFERIAGELGPVDLLVNNAGTMTSGPLWEIDPDRWWRDVEVSLRGAFLCSRAVLPAMLDRGTGRIVNVSSRIATRPDPLSSSYAAAKAAVTRMTDCLDAEVRGRGIRVFALNPGVVSTALTDGLLDDRWLRDDFVGMRDDDWSPPELAASIIARIATGEADALSGRFIDAPTGLDQQLAEVERTLAEDRWTLRLREGAGGNGS
jgi:NAD(P)-dependent dehydrogenase (short-subunit alcohol dehydrogenase family)